MKNSRPHPDRAERDRKELGAYRGKRRPGATNEPFGDERDECDESQSAQAASAEVGAFVVHLHDATRRHYDVRLEVGGVLWSFAVPKGPSLDPKERVLAVKTEDHPIEYLEFEDVIPDGQYGAGPMIAWDRGLVRYLEGPPEEELAQGKLHVELRGMKLRGRWAFVKLQKSDKGNEWLLFKKADESADPERRLVEELPRSVLSGLTVDELGDREAIGEALARRAIELGATATSGVVEALSEAPAPLAAAPDAELAPGATSIFEAELGGVRVLATRDGDVVELRTWENAGEIGHGHGRGHGIEELYPDIVRALRALPTARVALDGEIVVFDGAGMPSRTLLAQRTARLAVPSARVFAVVAGAPAFLIVHDVLAIGDADTRPLPVEARRALVSELFPAVGFLRAGMAAGGELRQVLPLCAGVGVAHVVAKKPGSAYDAPRAWTRVATGAPAAAPVAIDHAAAVKAAARGRQPQISNRSKVFWPDEDDGYTKGDLVDYYDAIAPALLPHLADRPTILVRYPDGITGKSFFQWNVPVGMPPWIRTMTMHEAEDFVAIVDPPASASRGARPSVVPPSRPPPSSQKTPRRGFLVDDRATLLYIANLGCIPLHVLASRAPDLTRADFFTLDFDVKQSELRHAITLARSLHEILDEIGLPGFPKTSGQSGLHVLVPLGPNQSFDTARALADLLGRLLVDRHPAIATMERIIARRGDRVYVDTGQTGISRAIVAPYSVRAVPGATVSAPLAWDEVGPKLDPRRFTMKTMPKRIEARGDLFAGLLEARPDIARAVARLTELVERTRARTP